jgi:phage gpG-like protein
MGADNSNATIGAIHEFGDATHPVRSFLRVPLKENLDRYLEKAGAFQQENFKQVIQDVSIVSWLSKVGQVAVNVVQDAFASAGFGKWKAWKNKSYTNNTGMILVDTQALRDSITYDVK